MDPAIIVASVAAVPAIIGGALGGYAALKQRGNENLNMVIVAMQQHMGTLASENTDMRSRVTSAEAKTNEALVKLAECETERRELKRAQEVERETFQREIDDLKQRMSDAESRDVSG